MNNDPANATSPPLPDYVERSHVGELSIRPPGVFTGAGTTIYTATGDKDAMQALASRFFDEPTGGEVTARVLGPLALFVFFNVDRLSSPAQPVGWTPNHEFSLTIPLVLEFKNSSRKARLGLWAPYVIIDNARGMVTGRESWGWFKGYGTINAPRNPTRDGIASELSTLIFKTFDPETEGSFEPLIRITPEPGTTPVIEKIEHSTVETFHLCQEFLNLLAEGVEDPDLFLNMVKLWSRHEIPAFNFKQFRSAEDATKACYQAITTCPLKITAIHGMSLLPSDLKVDITPCESHQIVEQLGFPGQSFRTGRCLFSEMDYEATNGEVLWEARR